VNGKFTVDEEVEDSGAGLGQLNDSTNGVPHPQSGQFKVGTIQTVPINTVPASDNETDLTITSDPDQPSSGRYRHLDPVRLALLEKRMRWICVLCRCAIVLFTALVAGVFTDFGLIVSLVGSLANSALCFSLPAVLYLKLCRPYSGHSWRFSAIPISLALFGVSAAIVGVYFSIAEMIHPPPSISRG